MIYDWDSAWLVPVFRTYLLSNDKWEINLSKIKDKAADLAKTIIINVFIYSNYRKSSYTVKLIEIDSSKVKQGHQ